MRTLAFADEGNSTPTARLKRKGIWTDSCTREPRNGAAGMVSPSELLCFGAFILRVSALVPQQLWPQSLLASSLVQGWCLFLGDGWWLAEPGWTLTLARGGVFSGSLIELGEGFCCSSSKDSVGVAVSPERTVELLLVEGRGRHRVCKAKGCRYRSLELGRRSLVCSASPTSPCAADRGRPTSLWGRHVAEQDACGLWSCANAPPIAASRFPGPSSQPRFPQLPNGP